MKTTDDRGYHILIVDDEPLVRQSIKMLLEHEGHKARTVESGEAALVLLEHETFDLIITDYFMQGMKGNQLAAIIKQRRPDQPIIMATAYAADFQPSGKPTGGVDWVLSKPFSMAELREAIALVMSSKAAPLTTPGSSDPVEGSPEVRPLPETGEAGAGRTRA